MRKPYPSDITREKYAQISHYLENAKKATCPRKIDLYEVFCAILYLLKNSCTWRALPNDFPDYRHVYYYWSIWTKKNEHGQSVMDHALERLVHLERCEIRRSSTPTTLRSTRKAYKKAVSCI